MIFLCLKESLFRGKSVGDVALLSGVEVWGSSVGERRNVRLLSVAAADGADEKTDQHDDLRHRIAQQLTWEGEEEEGDKPR